MPWEAVKKREGKNPKRHKGGPLSSGSQRAKSHVKCGSEEKGPMVLNQKKNSKEKNQASRKKMLPPRQKKNQKKTSRKKGRLVTLLHREDLWKKGGKSQVWECGQLGRPNQKARKGGGGV